MLTFVFCMLYRIHMPIVPKPNPIFKSKNSPEIKEERIAKLLSSLKLEGKADPDQPVEDWEYLIHHLHVDENTGEDIVHHCVLVDHLGNLYTVEHILDEKGDTRHCIAGLLEEQDVYWSNEEAEADGQKIPCANRQLE